MTLVSCHREEEEGERSTFMTTVSGDVGSLVFVAFTPEPLKSLCI
jgi:hypothetical protein